MRNWIAAGIPAALIAAGSARAVEQKETAAAHVDVVVADARSGAGSFSDADYGASERFGRAWVVLHYRTETMCPAAEGACEVDTPVDVSVPGLAYDAAARRVVYRPDGEEPVICATVRRRGFPWFGESFRPTGACTVRLEEVDRFVDDGFAGRSERREEVHFAVHRADTAPAPLAGASR